MNHDSLSARATLGVRLLALLFVTVGLWQGAANVIASATEFDPTYAGHYFQEELLRPVLAVALGAALAVCSRALGRRLARGLGES